MVSLIDLEDVRLGVHDKGVGSPALVFLHYWGGTSRTWSRVAERLCPRFRCIAIDQRGWGASTCSGDDFSLEAMADDVGRLTARLALDRYVLVGHSMGGKVAQIYASRRPLGLEAMVLVAPAPLSPIPASPDQRAAMLASYATEAGVRQALNILTLHRLDPELERQVVADTISGHDAAKYAWTDTGMIADFSSAAQTINVPTLVVVGREDRVEPVERMRAEVAANIAGSQFVDVIGCGHLLPLEAPEILAETIERFVSRRVNVGSPDRTRKEEDPSGPV